MKVFARASILAATAGLLAFAGIGAVQAKVRIAVDLDSQSMHVEASGKSYDWKISSGKKGYETPNGSYRVLWMDKDHFSDTYDQAPMPNAIFFAPGYAIHGAYKSPWGRRASHGCVRIPPAKAQMLFEMVKKQGAEITLTGGAEASTEVAEKLKHGGPTAPTEISPAAYARQGSDPGADPSAMPQRQEPRWQEPVTAQSPDGLLPHGLFGEVY